MSDSSYSGRFHSARSIIFSSGVTLSDCGAVDWIVSKTNWETCGQTRGFLELQMIRPIFGVSTMILFFVDDHVDSSTESCRAQMVK